MALITTLFLCTFLKGATRGEKCCFVARGGSAILLFLFLFPAGWGSGALAQGSDETVFEQLCRNFVNENSSSARLELLEFSQKNPQSPLATLGYYLLGYRDLQEGRPESALDALELALVGADQVPIPDFILFHHAEALHKLNRSARAIEGWLTYLRRFPRGHLARKAIAFLWEDALMAGSPQLIFDSHRDWPHLSKSAEALFYAAAAHESRGETRRSIDGYLRLHYRFPLSPASPKALAAINRLKLDQPGESFEVPPGWKRTRAEKLFKGKRYRQAVKALNAALETTVSPSERAGLQLQRGIAEFHSRRQRESLRTLQSLPPKFAVQPQALFYRAENYRRLDEDDSFLKTVRQIQQRYPNSSWLERAWFSLANSRLVKRELDEANRFYRMMSDRFSSGRRVTRAHWRVAWHHYRKRNRDRGALALFTEHLRAVSTLASPAGRSLLDRSHPGRFRRFRPSPGRLPGNHRALQQPLLCSSVQGAPGGNPAHRCRPGGAGSDSFRHSGPFETPHHLSFLLRRRSGSRPPREAIRQGQDAWLDPDVRGCRRGAPPNQPKHARHAASVSHAAPPRGPLPRFHLPLAATLPGLCLPVLRHASPGNMADAPAHRIRPVLCPGSSKARARSLYAGGAGPPGIGL